MAFTKRIASPVVCTRDARITLRAIYSLFALSILVAPTVVDNKNVRSALSAADAADFEKLQKAWPSARGAGRYTLLIVPGVYLLDVNTIGGERDEPIDGVMAGGTSCKTRSSILLRERQGGAAELRPSDSRAPGLECISLPVHIRKLMGPSMPKCFLVLTNVLRGLRLARYERSALEHPRCRRVAQQEHRSNVPMPEIRQARPQRRPYKNSRR